MSWAHRLLGVLAIGTLATTAIVGTAVRSMAGGQCPEIKGAPSPIDPSHVIRTFTDIDGCQVPVRVGIGHIPWMPSVDFGYEHLVSRTSEGHPEHEYDAAAMTQWQRALVEPGALVGQLYECHYAQYKAGKQKRTMLVYVDYKDYQGYAYKGIITAYWIPGYKQC